MASRLKLQQLLETIMENTTCPCRPVVYYQPPESVMLTYPCIIYSLSNINTDHADNKKYIKNRRYTVNYISKTVDDDVIEQLLDIPFCSHDRRYVANNLYHDAFTLFY